MTRSYALLLVLSCASLPPQPAHSTLVAVAGDHLLLDVSHVHAGAPTFIFLSGFGALGMGWVHVRAALDAQVSHAWLDRPGLGWTPAPSRPLTPDEQVEQLREALLVAHAPPPWVLVGHSLGASLALLWQSRHPEEVVGLALLSPALPEVWSLVPADEVKRAEAGYAALAWAPVAARFGLLECGNPWDLIAADLPPEEATATRFFARSPSHLAALAAEAQEARPTSPLMRRLVDLDRVPSVPTVWLHETEPSDSAFVRANAQVAESISQASQGRVRVVAVEGAGHVELLTRQPFAEHVARELSWLEAEVRR